MWHKELRAKAVSQMASALAAQVLSWTYLLVAGPMLRLVDLILSKPR